MENLAEILNIPFEHNQIGGLAAYLDCFVTALHELEVLEEGEYTQTQKKRMLFTNIRGAQGISHLTQKYRDAGHTMSFEEMTQYLRESSKALEARGSNKKRIMYTTEDEQSNEGFTMAQTMDLFEEVAKDMSIFQAYNFF